ncbi:hypothetical protein KJ918_06150 [Patescibacteria group bacterium]|nr:hypothetical protein [Patescibacteria group bacterium]
MKKTYLELFKNTFKGRNDAYGVAKGLCVKESLTDEVLLNHFMYGKEHVGVYPLLQDGTSYWIAIDFDNWDFENVKLCSERLKNHYQLSNYVEVSKSKGFHIWLFFNEPVLAKKSRVVVKHIVDEVAEGKIYELFPKQDVIPENGYGNYINLPLFYPLAQQGKTVFLNMENGGEPHKDQWGVLQSLKKAGKQTIEEIIQVNSLLNEEKAKIITPSTSEERHGLPCVRKMLSEGVKEGCRDKVAFVLAKQLRNTGMPKDIALDVLMGWDKKNQPPLGGGVLLKKIDSAMKGYRGYDCDDPLIKQFCDKSCPVYKKKEKKETKFERVDSIGKVRDVITTNFPSLWSPVETCLSVVSQLRIQDISHPFSLVLIGMPSSSKTTVLSFFYDIDNISYKSDKFTPRSFVSHASNVQRDKLEKIDLLPRIRNKVFITPEMAPIFGAQRDDLLENFSVLTRVLDGEGFTSESGVHGGRGYKGEYLFMWLGASTPIKPNVWKLMGNLGARLYFYKMADEEEETSKLVQQVIKDKVYKHKVRDCSQVVSNYLRTFWAIQREKIVWEGERDDNEVLNRIAELSQVLCCLRGAVNVWKSDYSDGDKPFQYQQPVVEKAYRATQLLYNLARGHAVLFGRNYLNEEDLPIVKKVALSSAPYERVSVMDALIRNEGIIDTTGLSEAINCSDRTALRIMESFKVLGIVDLDNVGASHLTIMRLKDKFKWLLEDEQFNF